MQASADVLAQRAQCRRGKPVYFTSTQGTCQSRSFETLEDISHMAKGLSSQSSTGWHSAHSYM